MRPGRAWIYSAYSILSTTCRICVWRWRRCRTTRDLRGDDLLHREHPGSRRDKYSLQYYVGNGEGAGENGRAHARHQGHGRPVPAARGAQAGEGAAGRDRIPCISTRTTLPACNPASVSEAAGAGVDIVDLAIASMSGSTSPAESQFDLPPRWQAQNATRSWTWTRSMSFPTTGRMSGRSTRPSTPRPRAGADVYLHEMPGGQYTNLKEQAEAWACPIAGRRSPAPTPRSTSCSATS